MSFGPSSTLEQKDQKLLPTAASGYLLHWNSIAVRMAGPTMSRVTQSQKKALLGLTFCCPASNSPNWLTASVVTYRRLWAGETHLIRLIRLEDSKVLAPLLAHEK